MKTQFEPHGGSPHRLDALFNIDGSELRCFIESDELALTPATEGLVAAGLLPAMRLSESISVNRPLSPRFQLALPTIQRIYHRWDERLRVVDIETPGTPSVPPPPLEPARVGSFFSGGVDSLFTLLRHRDEVTDLVFIHGYDIALDKQALREQAIRRIRRVAASYGKGVVEIRTNLRQVVAGRLDWLFVHGAMLAAVGHVLSGAFSRLFIPSSHSYADLCPWGSHPVLDPLWSTEQLEFVHDGCEATRVEKVEAIAQSDVALETLRVCWRNTNGAYNCGRCEKCIRTMISLRAAGALSRCTTFPEPLKASRVSDLIVTETGPRGYALENLQFLRRRGGAPAIERALERVLARSRFGNRLAEYRRRLRKRYPSLLERSVD